MLVIITLPGLKSLKLIKIYRKHFPTSIDSKKKKKKNEITMALPLHKGPL